MRDCVARKPPGNSIAAGVGDAGVPCLELMLRNALLDKSSLVATLFSELAIGEAHQGAINLILVKK